MKEFIDERRYPWLRIVKMQTIPIKNGNTYLHLAIEYGQIEIFEAILTEAANYWREAYQKKLAERNTGTVEDTEILVGKYYKCSCVGNQKRDDQSKGNVLQGKASWLATADDQAGIYALIAESRGSP